ncbi:GtrA family protein [Marinimicrobium sp. ABcell2]|uniref:GtrA family protein n=1 Tax=Marinimicrobium sp. ABcell2 TaxID=3069751 RepID=UPI0027AFF81D|nr:GtrA family protein [Marinimicrobium sp. ABcell2]MDQ2077322.1 GtrA family protein [Marinimicrobium sp. ABcell2]
MEFSRRVAFVQKRPPEAVCFLLVGGLATSIQYTLLISLVELSLLAPVAASLTGYMTAALINYLLNYYFTFSSSADHRVAMVRFLAVVGVGLSANGGIMYLGTEVLQLHYLAVQLSATLVILMWNFLAHKLWTYQSEPVTVSAEDA